MKRENGLSTFFEYQALELFLRRFQFVTKESYKYCKKYGYISSKGKEMKRKDNEIPDERNDEIDIEIEQIEKNENEEEEYKTKDPVRKFQYDYNITTCMTNKFPEADSESTLDFAPAEGKVPTNILKDVDWDINSLPVLEEFNPTATHELTTPQE